MPLPESEPLITHGEAQPGEAVVRPDRPGDPDSFDLHTEYSLLLSILERKERQNFAESVFAVEAFVAIDPMLDQGLKNQAREFISLVVLVATDYFNRHNRNVLVNMETKLALVLIVKNIIDISSDLLNEGTISTQRLTALRQVGVNDDLIAKALHYVKDQELTTLFLKQVNQV